MWRQVQIGGALRWYWDEGQRTGRRFFTERPRAWPVVVPEHAPAPSTALAARSPATPVPFGAALPAACEILGIRASTPYELARRRFRELVKVHHPDQGGDAEAFDAIVWAWRAWQALRA